MVGVWVCDNWCLSREAYLTSLLSVSLDVAQTIVDLLKPRLKGIEDSSDSIAFVTYQMYGIIRELLYGILDQTPDLFESCSEGT